MESSNTEYGVTKFVANVDSEGHWTGTAYEGEEYLPKGSYKLFYAHTVGTDMLKSTSENSFYFIGNCPALVDRLKNEERGSIVTFL